MFLLNKVHIIRESFTLVNSMIYHLPFSKEYVVILLGITNCISLYFLMLLLWTFDIQLFDITNYLVCGYDVFILNYLFHEYCIIFCASNSIVVMLILPLLNFIYPFLVPFTQPGFLIFPCQSWHIDLYLITACS